MPRKRLWIAACVVSLAVASSASAAPTVKMVPVEKSVRLEVLDWGGSGPPLIFLSGFGGTAHTFEGFAEKFTRAHHVYAITRRGFGRSSHPPPSPSAYTPEQLAADIVRVINILHIDRPFLAGHSLAGQELSEIGTHYPDQVRGLIYLDAADAQAFYGQNSDVLYPIAGQLRRDLEGLIKSQPSQARVLIEKIRAELPRLERGLSWYEKAVKDAPDRPPNIDSSPGLGIQHAIVEGAHVYGPVNLPVLAIVALPIQCDPDCNSDAAKRRERAAELQAADFSQANQSARVVRIPYADHFIWESNEKAVVNSMDQFMKDVSR
jgi:non-heme chloroperoxidase